MPEFLCFIVTQVFTVYDQLAEGATIRRYEDNQKDLQGEVAGAELLNKEIQ